MCYNAYSIVSYIFQIGLSLRENHNYLLRCIEGVWNCKSLMIHLLLQTLKKYYTQAGDQDDLISIGTIGLIKGVSTFKPDKNVRLATYVSRCIENAILSQMRL